MVLNIRVRFRSIELLLLGILLSGCATQMPAPVREAGAPDQGGTINSMPSQSKPAEASIPSRSATESSPAWKPNVQARATLPAVVELLNKADRLMANGSWDEAILTAERGLRIDARNPDLYLVLAQSYMALGEAGKARLFAEQGRSLSSSASATKNRFNDILAELSSAS